LLFSRPSRPPRQITSGPRVAEPPRKSRGAVENQLARKPPARPRARPAYFRACPLPTRSYGLQVRGDPDNEHIIASAVLCSHRASEPRRPWVLCPEFYRVNQPQARGGRHPAPALCADRRPGIVPRSTRQARSAQRNLPLRSPFGSRSNPGVQPWTRLRRLPSVRRALPRPARPRARGTHLTLGLETSPSGDDDRVATDRAPAPPAR